MKTFYFSIYNPETKEVYATSEVSDEAKVKDRVSDYPNETDLLLPYTQQEYAMEVMGRGVPWKVYCEDEPFDWTNLYNGTVVTATQKKAIDEAIAKAKEAAE